MQSIALLSKERKERILRMKRERKPSRRLRMHIVLLFCSRTTVYAVAHRFVGEGPACSVQTPVEFF